MNVVGVKALADCWISFKVGAFALKKIELLTRVFGLLLSTTGGSILLRFIGGFVDILLGSRWRHLAKLVIEALKRLESIAFLFLSLKEFIHVVHTKTFYIWRVLRYLIILLVVKADVDILIEIVCKLKDLLDSTFFEVVVDVISLLGLFFFEIMGSHWCIFEGFLHFRLLIEFRV